MKTEVEKRLIYQDVMECFYRGELKHGSTGEIVVGERVARGIAASKSGIRRKRGRPRAKSGSR